MLPPSIIYLIDDSEIDCFITRNSLESMNPEDKVITFHSTEEALTLLKNLNKESYPTYILLDLSMPKINGWEFLEAYTALPNYPFNNCKVVILSSSIHPIDTQRAKQYVCITDCISKPLIDR